MAVHISAGHVGPVEQLAVHASFVFLLFPSWFPVPDNDGRSANQRTGAEEL